MNTEIQELIEAVKSVAKEWLTPDELKEEFSISTSTQAKMRMSKKIPYHKVGSYVRYKRSDINEMFDSAKIV